MAKMKSAKKGLPDEADKQHERSDGPDDRLYRLVGHRLRLAHLRAVNCFEEAFDGLSLTPIEYGILECIKSSPVLAQIDLATRLQTAPSVLVGCIAKLEKKGLIDRLIGDDRRRYELVLTSTGLERLREARLRIARSEARLTRNLGREEVSSLLELLGRLTDRRD
jgi:DNA-binding MarR family transcriptional regulator